MEIKRYDKLAIFFKKEKIVIYNLSILLSTAFTLFIENRIIMGSWVRLYVSHTKSCFHKDIGLIFAAVFGVLCLLDMLPSLHVRYPNCA